MAGMIVYIFYSDKDTKKWAGLEKFHVKHCVKA